MNLALTTKNNMYLSILNKIIINIYSTSSIEKDGYGGETIYLELSDKKIYTVPFEDQNSEVVNIDSIKSDSTFSLWQHSFLCKGLSINAVLESPLLPFHSLLLSNQKVIVGNTFYPTLFSWAIANYTIELIKEYDFKNLQ